MKGIFIKNMEMPNNCNKCPFIVSTYVTSCLLCDESIIHNINERPDWCPLNEITECNDVVDLIKEVTDAPKQEIVKCGDCVYYSSIDMLCIRPREVAGVFMLENEWCKYGKRRNS